jgi:hypothetical protein
VFVHGMGVGLVFRFIYTVCSFSSPGSVLRSPLLFPCLFFFLSAHHILILTDFFKKIESDYVDLFRDSSSLPHLMSNRLYCSLNSYSYLCTSTSITTIRPHPRPRPPPLSPIPTHGIPTTRTRARAAPPSSHTAKRCSAPSSACASRSTSGTPRSWGTCSGAWVVRSGEVAPPLAPTWAAASSPSSSHSGADLVSLLSCVQ